MKLLLLLFLLCGCTYTSFNPSTGTFKRLSILQKVEVPHLTITTNGTVTLKGYANDGGGEATGVIVGHAVEGVVRGMKPPGL